MVKKNNQIKLLKKEIEVKDKLIGALLQEIIKNNISLPDYVVSILKTLYKMDLSKYLNWTLKELNNGGKKETKN